jgi:butyrate kinase
MLADLRSGRYGEHASNLGAPLAREIADRADCPAYVVDPIVVDELDDASRLSGHPEIPCISVFHALNQRSVARLVARRMGREYRDCRFIVAHMGGGISVGGHLGGRVVEVNNALDGDGPFTPERSGSLPVGQLVSFCFRSGKTEKEIRRMIKGAGGLVAYCGTNDLRDLEKMADRPGVHREGYPHPSVVFEALCRQISREICARAVVFEGRVDAVILTGGMAFSVPLVKRLKEMCGWVAPVEVVPGEREMEALAEGAYRVLHGEEPAREYRG